MNKLKAFSNWWKNSGALICWGILLVVLILLFGNMAVAHMSEQKPCFYLIQKRISVGENTDYTLVYKQVIKRPGFIIDYDSEELLEVQITEEVYNAAKITKE